jgi:hypothetical protein
MGCTEQQPALGPACVHQIEVWNHDTAFVFPPLGHQHMHRNSQLHLLCKTATVAINIGSAYLVHLAHEQMSSPYSMHTKQLNTHTVACKTMHACVAAPFAYLLSGLSGCPSSCPSEVHRWCNNKSFHWSYIAGR